MGKKYSWSILLLLLLLLVSACTVSELRVKKLIGKQLPYSKLQVLADSGHHFWKHKHLDIDYDYWIDSKTKTITFDGTAKYNLSTDESKYKSETVLLNIKYLQFLLIFADFDRTVVAVEVFYVSPDTPIYEPISFKKTVPYEDSYYYLLFVYEFRAKGN